MSDQIVHFIRKPSYLRIAQDRVVRLKYAVSDVDAGRTIEYRDDLYYLHGGYGGAFPKVEAALAGLEVGDKAEVELTPAEGYGERQPELVIQGPAEQFPPEAQQVGALLDGEAADGHVVQFVVTAVEDGMVSVDGNHPLAGRRLHFVFEVLDVREARPDELTAGRVLSDQVFT